MTNRPCLELDLPYPPRQLAPNARVFWAEKQRRTREYKTDVYYTAKAQYAGKAVVPLNPPVTAHTTFVVTTNRKRDEDNLSASIKALWDALVQLGLLAGDDAERLHHAPIAIEKGKKACVRVRLEAAS